MNNLQIFNSEQFGRVRVIMSDNEPKFIAKDVCEILGISKYRDALNRLDPDEGCTVRVDTPGGKQEMRALTESGLYTLIIRSDKQEAKPFRKWITAEVLPTIRKHGAYLTEQKVEEVLTDPDTIIRIATQLKEERAARQRLAEQNELHKQQLQIATPKVQYYNEVLMSTSTYTANQVAKELGMSAITLNRKLRERGVQYLQNGQWLLYSKYQGKGYTKTHTHPFVRSDGSTGTAMQTVWTEAGRLFIHSLFKA